MYVGRTKFFNTVENNENLLIFNEYLVDCSKRRTFAASNQGTRASSPATDAGGATRAP